MMEFQSSVRLYEAGIYLLEAKQLVSGAFRVATKKTNKQRKIFELDKLHVPITFSFKIPSMVCLTLEIPREPRYESLKFFPRPLSFIDIVLESWWAFYRMSSSGP
jgi:hypothetical protein